MKIAQKHLLEMGIKLRNLKLAFKNAQKNNIPGIGKLIEDLHIQKDLTRSFHIAYTLTKKKAGITPESSEAEISKAIFDYRIKTKSNKESKRYIVPNLKHIKSYMEGFES